MLNKNFKNMVSAILIISIVLTNNGIYTFASSMQGLISDATNENENSEPKNYYEMYQREETIYVEQSIVGDTEETVESEEKTELEETIESEELITISSTSTILPYESTKREVLKLKSSESNATNLYGLEQIEASVSNTIHILGANVPPIPDGGIENTVITNEHYHKTCGALETIICDHEYFVDHYQGANHNNEDDTEMDDIGVVYTHFHLKMYHLIKMLLLKKVISI